MIQLKDGKLRPELLDKNGTLSEGIISQYDYIELKNNFEEIVDILETNKLVHALYQEYLNYEIGEDLEFKIVANNIPNLTMTNETREYPAIVSDTDTNVITLDRKAYDTSLAMCAVLLKRVKMSYDKLNEVEKFIIKSLEFDNPKSTDEDLMDRLMTYKNGYYLCKKSAFIKMSLQLNIKMIKKRENDDYLKQLIAEHYIISIPPDDRKKIGKM